MTISPAQATTALFSLAFLLLIAVIWRGYTHWRLDLFREQLFALRGELFDYAATGNIAFENVSYVMLRTMLNGLLRFGHRIDGLPFLIAMSQIAIDDPEPSFFMVRWNREAMSLDVDQRTTLDDMLRRAHVAVLEQAILSSAIIAAASVAGFVYGAIFSIIDRATRRLRAPFGRLYERHGARIDARLMRRIDDIAFEEGSLAA